MDNKVNIPPVSTKSGEPVGMEPIVGSSGTKKYIVVSLVAFTLLLAVVFIGYKLFFMSDKESVDDRKADTAIQSAIDADDAVALSQFLKSGADANLRLELAYRPVPVMYAVAQYKKKALAELLKNGGDPNLRDEEGDTAVTLAVETYARDPEILAMVLEAGGDPNTRRSDDDPVIIRFVNDANLEGIRFMKGAGADIDVYTRTEDPLIVWAAGIEYWDVVWTLLDLGARYDTPGSRFTIADFLNNPKVTPPDSPIYSYKVKVWNFLHDKGVELPPLDGLEKKGEAL